VLKSKITTVIAALAIAASVAFGAPAKLGTTTTYWELVGGVLTISGVGFMPDWSSSNYPWASSRGSITKVVIEEGVTSIGSSAFEGCYMLTGTLTIPNSVISIGSSAFEGCANLTAISIPNSVTSIGNYAFSSCTILASVNISDSVTSIGESAFNNCRSLKSVSIPNSVTSIGGSAFYYCINLTSVIIGNSVASIGKFAFAYCFGLKQVINLRATPQVIDAEVFEGFQAWNFKSITLYVPAQTLAAYKAANVWKSFTVATPFTLDKKSLALAAGESQTLNAAFDAGYAESKIIKWSSANPAVASINNDGAITAKAVGTVIITATTQDDFFSDVCAVSVEKGTPAYSKPENLTAIYGQTLANVALSGGWSWESAPTTSVGNAGTRTHKAKFTPADTANYNILTNIDLSIEVEKAKITKPVVYTVLTYTGSVQYADIATNAAYTINGNSAIAAGGYTATVSLIDTANYVWVDGSKIDLTLNWSIVKADAREIKVVWEEKREFEYNKMIQVPQWTIEPYDEVVKSRLRITNEHSAAGKYTAQNNRAPYIVILPEYNDGSYRLSNTSVDYEITPKPLDVVLKDNTGKITGEVSVAKTAKITVGGAIESLKPFVGYTGFATDTVSKQSDNAGNSLSGAPRFEISRMETGSHGRSSRDGTLKIGDLIENGDYKVSIKVGDIIAQNYALNDGQAVLKVSDLFLTFSTTRDDEGGASPIRDKKKSDNKHGILLEKSVVSDVAKINIKTPEQAQINLAIYDNAGNVVFKASGKNTDTFVWNLTNNAGRNVANGTYLIIAEAKGAKGTYAYSMNVGVRR